MKTTMFNTRIYPMNDDIFAIEVKSNNYHANIDTTILVNRKSMQVCDTFQCNCFVDARSLVEDISKETRIKIKSDHINRFGMYC